MFFFTLEHVINLVTMTWTQIVNYIELKASERPDTELGFITLTKWDVN